MTDLTIGPLKMLRALQWGVERCRLAHAGWCMYGIRGGAGYEVPRRYVCRTQARSIGVWAALLGLLFTATGLAQPMAAKVRVSLREEVDLPPGRVTLGDIADISGGPASLKQQLVRLEVDEVAEAGKEVLISQRRIVYRLQLAGIDLDRIHIEGARVARVRFRSVVSHGDSRDGAVLVAAKPLQPGEVITDANTRLEYRPSEGEGVIPAQAYGRRLARPISANQVIRAEYLTSSDQPTLVKKGELVRLMARVGPLEISARGEALSDGKLGQIIPVRNVDSKQTVHARVIRPATVQVDY